ncbi:MAG: 16S rRNA (guanine(527)-N(7))-methyltransferase RsmG [Candidatus Izemoplasma sp.]|nr:16S rRNA (guanine(527)-N(7))-methyltransferase RsmG [Candidatus Izemoplasma sp.]
MQAFIQKLEAIDILLSKKQIQQFEDYYRLLVEWNQKVNLTAITSYDEVLMKHFYDSIMMGQIITLNDQKILDVGSGAGFPSIPLKIVYPNLDVTIIDALNKRITFLKTLTKELGLEARLIHGRAESFKEKATYDIVTARAVANLQMLSELCIPFVKKDGAFIVLKGPKFEDELAQSQKAFDILGVTETKRYSYRLLDAEHILIQFKKVKETPDKYPRRFKKIKSNPL